jgi:RNA recognition motif-containing protein
MAFQGALARQPECGSIGVPYWSRFQLGNPRQWSEDNRRMSFTVFLGNLPVWVTADDIKGWLAAENLVADAIKVIRNPETQESKGFAFIEAPNTEEMNAIIRRFDRAPLEDRLLRANPAQPPRPKGSAPGGRPMGGPPTHAGGHTGQGHTGQGHAGQGHGGQGPAGDRPRRAKKGGVRRSGNGNPSSAFAEELAKAL